jgi:uncharacterized protein (TIGR03435 family)
MLRRLLIDRFKLIAHYETRELRVYSLVKAREDGRLGPSLRRSDVDCAALRAAAGDRPIPAAPGQKRPCIMGFGRSQITGDGLTIVSLTSMLSRYVNRDVIDRTGLEGGFDWVLEWTPDGQVAADSERPSIFTAIQEQLGLKLQAQDGTVQVLIIDSVERPTPD